VELVLLCFSIRIAIHKTVVAGRWILRRLDSLNVMDTEMG